MADLREHQTGPLDGLRGLNNPLKGRIMLSGRFPGREAPMDFLLQALAAIVAGLVVWLVTRWFDRR